jgi:hypothetical protein
MKKRLGFVSNSSSSSFVCDLSGNCEGGYDCGLSDVDMFECENGHTLMNEFRTLDFGMFCEFVLNGINDGDIDCPDDLVAESGTLTIAEVNNYLIGVVTTYSRAKSWLEEQGFDIGDYEVPSCFCPICAMQELPDSSIVKYLIKSSGRSEKEIVAEIREKFKDYNTFSAWLRAK